MAVSVGELINAYRDTVKYGAIQKNPEFQRLVQDRVLDIITRNQARVQNITGYYHDTINGNVELFPYVGTRDYFPGLDRSHTASSFRKVIDTLIILVSKGIVGLDERLDVRRIDWDTGSGNFIDGTPNELNEQLNKLELPTTGQFIATDRPELPNFSYQTFNAIDATILVAMGNIVSEVDFLDTITISIHRAKASAYMLGKKDPAGFGRGHRTIAGTMIFTEGPEDPLIRLYPSSIMPVDEDFVEGRRQLHNAYLLPDQLPPFSLIIVWQNEYGQAKQLTLYDIEITDTAYEYSKRNMEDQVVVQYKAIDFDPPRRVRVDRDGRIDPFGLSKGGTSPFWERLWLIRNGSTVHENVYEKTDEYFQTVDVLSSWATNDPTIETLNSREITIQAPININTPNGQ